MFKKITSIALLATIAVTSAQAYVPSPGSPKGSSYSKPVYKPTPRTLGRYAPGR